MGKLKGFLVGLTTFVGATALTAGGIALNNHFNKDKITLSYGDKTYFGDQVNSGATDDIQTEVQLDKNLSELNAICKENNFMLMLVVCPATNMFEADLQIVYGPEQVKSNLMNSKPYQLVVSNPALQFKGWSLSENGPLLENFDSIYKNEVVIVYAITEKATPFYAEILGQTYTCQKTTEGISIEIDPTSVAPEGYFFIGWSLGSSTDLDNLTDLSNITDGQIVYAVFVNENNEPYDIAEHSFTLTLNYWMSALEGQQIKSIIYYNGNYLEDVNFCNPIANDDGTFYNFVGFYKNQTVDEFNPELVVDLNSFVPNSNATLYALYERDGNYYTAYDFSSISFQWESVWGMYISTYTTLKNDLTDATNYAKSFVPFDLSEGKTFVGWSTVENDLNYIVDFAQTEAVPNTVYFAIFEDIQAEVINFKLHYLSPSTGKRYSSHHSSDRLDLSKDHYDLINPDGTSFLFAGFVSDDDRYELDNADIITDLTNHQFYEGEHIYVVYTDDLNNLYTLYDLFAMKFTTADQNTFYYSKMDDHTMAKLYAQTYIPEHIPEGQSFAGWSTVENDPENIVDFENYDFIGYDPSSGYPATFYAIFEDISLQ